MAKILISPLGTGPANREYRKATYQISEQKYESSFIASVLHQHLKLDGIIFIGTVKSMWEEVYRVFCEERGKQIDKQYHDELKNTIKGLDCNSLFDALNLSSLEEVLGYRSKCMLIKYGLNDTELWENFDIVAEIINSLHNGDEVFIDITHSFRSLSMFLFLVLVLIKDLHSEKNIKISGVYYGMLDVVSELHYAPVVDLKPLFELTDWSKGIHNLKKYGNGDLIANLMRAKGENDLANRLQEFSLATDINYSTSITQKAQKLRESLAKVAPVGPFQYIKKYIETFLDKLDKRNYQYESNFQLELANWYFENGKYATGYITMHEAIVTYVCEINGREASHRRNREWAKQYEIPQNRNYELARLYSKITRIRNNIAHALKADDAIESIKKAPNYQQQIETIVNEGTWGRDFAKQKLNN